MNAWEWAAIVALAFLVLCTLGFFASLWLWPPPGESELWHEETDEEYGRRSQGPKDRRRS